MNNYTEALSIEMKIQYNFIIDIFLCTNIIIFLELMNAQKKFKKNSTMAGYDRISIRQLQ